MLNVTGTVEEVGKLYLDLNRLKKMEALIRDIHEDAKIVRPDVRAHHEPTNPGGVGFTSFKGSVVINDAEKFLSLFGLATGKTTRLED